jgi:predicted metal-dependent hydrolase
MTEWLDLGSLRVEVRRKAIKHVHLSVLPPSGKVRLAAPVHTPLETLRLFAIAKLAWVRGEQRRLRSQEREPPREYLGKESHYVWGKRYLLDLQEAEARPEVQLKPRRLLMRVRPGTGTAQRSALMEAWYRQQLRDAIAELLPQWEQRLGVRSQKLFVQRMRTKWGSCTPASAYIRLNTELAKKPLECLEYILVHELVHLLEPSHNQRFVALMDKHLPRWRELQQRLNRLPVRHEDWDY